MSIFSKKIELTKKEQLIANCITEALIDQSSEIHCDSLGKRYAIFNEKCHFRMTLIGDSYMIRLTNTISNDGEKYRDKFINYIIKLIIVEKNQRMDKLFASVDATMERLATDMYQLLLSNNTEAKLKQDEKITWENAPLDARIEAVLGMNLNDRRETVLG